ncbi:hypothetical protein T440DRAFT_540106 [Plenodomus tracheiphilus IPT5]|uniref:Uncharacterized protein n=1 Tax=Plenodomus tracheiphilus IPT5 TaxID=1408161 RepID=A0A6A7AV89_9PLEO|nr:hypothetical protein T440DRAFT_540106 [Plenodomus tracheiphilus IPT5]
MTTREIPRPRRTTNLHTAFLTNATIQFEQEYDTNEKKYHGLNDEEQFEVHVPMEGEEDYIDEETYNLHFDRTYSSGKDNEVGNKLVDGDKEGGMCQDDDGMDQAMKKGISGDAIITSHGLDDGCGSSHAQLEQTAEKYDTGSRRRSGYFDGSTVLHNGELDVVVNPVYLDGQDTDGVSRHTGVESGAHDMHDFETQILGGGIEDTAPGSTPDVIKGQTSTDITTRTHHIPPKLTPDAILAEFILIHDLSFDPTAAHRERIMLFHDTNGHTAFQHVLPASPATVIARPSPFHLGKAHTRVQQSGQRRSLMKVGRATVAVRRSDSVFTEMSPNKITVRLDSPILPTFSRTLSDKKLSCITEAPIPQHYPTSLGNRSPPFFQNPDTPTLPNSRSFLYSPSLSSERGDLPILPAFPSKHSSTSSGLSTSSSQFGGAYPTPPISYLCLDTPETHYRRSWYSSLSTASTSVSPDPQYRSERMSDILPDDMEFYAEDVDGYMFQPLVRGDVGATAPPLGLGLELPFIAEQDFAYYPKAVGAVNSSRETETNTLESAERGSEARKEKRKGGVRFVVGTLISYKHNLMQLQGLSQDKPCGKMNCRYYRVKQLLSSKRIRFTVDNRHKSNTSIDRRKYLSSCYVEQHIVEYSEKLPLL